MAENEKINPPKAGDTAAKPTTAAPPKTPPSATPPATSPATPPATPPGPRTAPDSPGDKVTVGDVKTPVNPSSDANVKAHVEATAKSVEAANKASAEVASAKPFVKPENKTVPAPTADDRMKAHLEATAKSADNYNKSTEEIKKASIAPAGEKLTPEVTRVAPLTGELREDPSDDSYVAPGKTLAPRTPIGEGAEIPPEVEAPPLVIAPLTGEIKPADEVSYPLAGLVQDPSAVMKAAGADKTFRLPQTKYGVPEGHQVSLLQANQEAWNNDAAIKEDRAERAQMLAEAMLSSDGLRRTRRVQKNLR